MTYTYLGTTPRFLASGRPITFGTELQEGDLELADNATKAWLRPSPFAAPVAREEAPAPAPVIPEPAPEVAPEPAPAEAPAPAEDPAEAPSLDPQPVDAPAFAGRGASS